MLSCTTHTLLLPAAHSSTLQPFLTHFNLQKRKISSSYNSPQYLATGIGTGSKIARQTVPWDRIDTYCGERIHGWRASSCCFRTGNGLNTAFFSPNLFFHSVALLLLMPSISHLLLSLSPTDPDVLPLTCPCWRCSAHAWTPQRATGTPQKASASPLLFQSVL